MLIRIVPQASEQQARNNLGRAVEDRGEDLTGLSRLLGRHAGYLGRYVRRGSPAMLLPSERAVLASYLRISEQALGAPMET